MTVARVDEAPAPAESAWLSCGQAARLLGLTPSRTSQLRREGRLRAIKTQLGYLFDPQDVSRFIKQRKGSK